MYGFIHFVIFKSIIEFSILPSSSSSSSSIFDSLDHVAIWKKKRFHHKKQEKKFNHRHHHHHIYSYRFKKKQISKHFQYRYIHTHTSTLYIFYMNLLPLYYCYFSQQIDTNIQIHINNLHTLIHTYRKQIFTSNVYCWLFFVIEFFFSSIIDFNSIRMESIEKFSSNFFFIYCNHFNQFFLFFSFENYLLISIFIVIFTYIISTLS